MHNGLGIESGFILLFGLSMLYLATTSRIISHIRIIIAQGILLFLICCLAHTEHTGFLNFAFLTFETLIVKSIIIPMFLFKVLKSTNANRDFAPNVPHFYCLVIASVILLAGFLVSNYWISSVITIKNKILSNVIEFITMENGIFLLSLSVSKEMPMLVNLGVLLDIFIAVYILGLFVNVINKEFKDLDVSNLSDLKDYEYND